ncbi:MAG: PadR family transcriptional regulator [Actinomycetota bacterium]|nr:PadR family transcriptional regulator [Actinomycetota bacterium]
MDAPYKLPATAYVVLGLVSIRPGAGHELAGFSDRSIGNFFPIARSQVYSELERLCRLGLLSVTEVPQRRFPTKRVYEVTEEGDAALRRWLDEAAVEPERNRNLFLVRVFFGDRVSHARLDALLDEYEAKARAHRDAMAALVARLADRPQSTYPRATALFGLRHAQATLDWVADVRSIVEQAACRAE